MKSSHFYTAAKCSHYRQKYAKTPVRFQYFKSYDRLYHHMYEHFRHSSVYQNLPMRADFIITTTYLLQSKIRFISNFSHFTNLYVVEFNSSVSK